MHQVRFTRGAIALLVIGVACLVASLFLVYGLTLKNGMLICLGGVMFIATEIARVMYGKSFKSRNLRKVGDEHS
jgi:membrane-bound ClpP family serine protease